MSRRSAWIHSRQADPRLRPEHQHLGTTIILTTHAMFEAGVLCDRIGIIDLGTIVALDTPANLKKMVNGADTSVMELDIPNLNKDVVTRIESLPCAQTIVIEDDTHLKVHASGEDACGDVLDAVRMG